ncbi:MAG: hypothetical protein AAGA77_08375 [Bacteroidota bacterium]
MKTNFNYFLFSILFIVTITSCSDADSNCNVNNFKFLQDGNELTYEFAGFACLFSDRLKVSYFAGEENGFVITNECFLSGSEEFSTEFARVPIHECSGDLYALDAEGKFMTDNFRYKGNRSLGDTWTNIDENNVSATYTVLEKDISVEVPEGTHICDMISYAQEGAFNVDTIYFNNEVGFVKYSGILQEYALLEKNF